MALVEKYHVVAAVRPVATDQTIKEGQMVALNGNGQVVLQGANYKVAYGIAGDTKNTAGSYMPGINYIAGGTIQQGWQNRVSDYFDETKASGKMTVYHSGGEFATDQFHDNVAGSNPYTALCARNGILDTHDQDGVSGGTFLTLVGFLTQTAAAYPSGVPGTNVNGDIALAGEHPAPAGSAHNDQYIEFKLRI